MIRDLEARRLALPVAQLRARLRAAGLEFRAALDGLPASAARTRPVNEGWSVATVADHVAQSTIRAAEEIRHLLAGRRPPGPPVYEGLVSGAAERLPWATVVEDLAQAVTEFDRVLGTAPDPAGDPATEPTAQVILAVPRTPAGPDEPGEVVFPAELDWRGYALVQRLHLLGHRTQIRRLRSALGL